jgi:hypothetical protein
VTSYLLNMTSRRRICGDALRTEVVPTEDGLYVLVVTPHEDEPGSGERRQIRPEHLEQLRVARRAEVLTTSKARAVSCTTYAKSSRCSLWQLPAVAWRLDGGMIVLASLNRTPGERTGTP